MCFSVTRLQLLTIAALVFGPVFGLAATPAQARDYPWCVYYGIDGSTYNCGFVSYNQCMATAYGTGYCDRNPRYRGEPVRRYRVKKRRS